MVLLRSQLLIIGLVGLLPIGSGCRLAQSFDSQRSSYAHQKQAQSQQARQAGNLAEARRLLQQAIRVNPSDPGNHYQLAEVFANENNAPAAVDQLMRCAELAPGDARTHTRMARLMYDHGDEEKAREYVEAALRLDPYRVEALVVRARLNWQQKRREEAVSDYLMALSQKPYPVEVAVELAVLYQLMDRHHEAVQLLQRGLRKSEELPETQSRLLWQIGLAYAGTEQWTLSTHYLRKGIEAQSTPSPERMQFLAQVEIQAGEYTAAERTLRDLLKQEPLHEVGNRLLAELHDVQTGRAPLVRTVSAETLMAPR